MQTPDIQYFVTKNPSYSAIASCSKFSLGADLFFSPISFRPRDGLSWERGTTRSLCLNKIEQYALTDALFKTLRRALAGGNICFRSSPGEKCVLSGARVFVAVIVGRLITTAVRFAHRSKMRAYPQAKTKW